MSNPIYGEGSNPTAAQIAQAIIEHRGECAQVVDWCVNMRNHPVSNRGGDNCPFWDESRRRSCPPTSSATVIEARKYLMEENEHH